MINETTMTMDKDKGGHTAMDPIEAGDDTGGQRGQRG